MNLYIHRFIFINIYIFNHTLIFVCVQMHLAVFKMQYTYTKSNVLPLCLFRRYDGTNIYTTKNYYICCAFY